MKARRNAVAYSLMLFLVGCANAPPSALPRAPTGSRWPLPFDAGTYIGSVNAPRRPTVERFEDLFRIWVPTETSDPVECLLSNSGVAEGGSAIAIARRSDKHIDLATSSVSDLAVLPEVPALLMQAHRRDGSSVQFAAYRDSNKSMVCLHEHATTADVLKRTVTDLSASLRAVGETEPLLVRQCTQAIEDGTLGFERLEVRRTGSRFVSHSFADVAYRYEATVDFMEADGSEASDERGQIDVSFLDRVIGGQPDRHSRFARQTAGTYEYEARDRSRNLTGSLQTQNGGGLPATIAIARQIKEDLVGGRVRSFSAETYDPFSSPDATLATTYTLTSHEPLTLSISMGWRTSTQVINTDGFTIHAESTLSGNETLLTTCTYQRGRL